MDHNENADGDETRWEAKQEELLHADFEQGADADNVSRFGLDAHPVVFPVSLAMIGLFLAGTILLGETAATFYDSVNAFINANFGWLYILAANAFIVALLGIAASKYGEIRIGGLGATPAYSTFEWMAMLFSAGMGIGLMFWSVAEPMAHLGTGGGTMFPFEPNTGAAARQPSESRTSTGGSTPGRSTGWSRWGCPFSPSTGASR